MFILQQRNDINLYSFNKVSWFEGYDNKVQHFEKWRSVTAIMTIRHSTLSVSWYEGVYHKVSVEEK